MGYDSKLYIVNKSNTPVNNEQGKSYAQVIATFDACVFPPLRKIFTQPTDCYFYADDGNTEVREDCYGKPLTEASVEAVVTCLENLTGDDAIYRRVPPMLAMLRAFRDSENQWESLAVLHYGH